MTSSMHKWCMSFVISRPLIGSPMMRWLASRNSISLSSRWMIWRPWSATVSECRQKKRKVDGWFVPRFSMYFICNILCWWEIWVRRSRLVKPSSLWDARASIPEMDRPISSSLSRLEKNGDKPWGAFSQPEGVKSGEELWRVVDHSSPLATPVFIGVSG